MVRSLTKILKGLFLLFAAIYLLIPPPKELPPLPNSLKSIEPGDTVQIPGISAYYTDFSRQEVMDFYQKKFSQSMFLHLPLITYRLSHPPEYARETIRETLQSTYYEEIVHPLRESLYVNGYEWATDPFTKSEARQQNKWFIDGKEYRSKVTIIARYSNPLWRLVVFGSVLLIMMFLFREFKGFSKEVFRRRKSETS